MVMKKREFLLSITMMPDFGDSQTSTNAENGRSCLRLSPARNGKHRELSLLTSFNAGIPALNEVSNGSSRCLS